MNQIASANKVGLAYVAEATYGVTPSGPPTLQDIRFTSESLQQATGTTESAEIRSDRQTPDISRNSVSVTGAVNFELSAGTYDDWLASALGSAGWSSVVMDISGATTITAVSADNSFNDSANGLANYDVGQWILVSGFTKAENNGLFKIVSVTASKIVVSHGALVNEAAGPAVTIEQGAQIVNGTNQDSYSIERVYADLANQFVIFTGMVIDQFSLNIQSDQIITGSFGFLGAIAASASATVGDGSNTAPPITGVINAIDNVTALFDETTKLEATEFSLQLQNNLRSQFQIAKLGPVGIGDGKIGLSGSLSVYLKNSVLIDKYLNFTETSLTLQLVDGDGNRYVIDIPAIKFTDGKRVAGGQNQDIIAEMRWSAKRDIDEGITIRIARFVA